MNLAGDTGKHRATGSDAGSVAAGLRVLVAEDHDFQRRALSQLLQTLGADEVREACDGAEALHQLRDDDGDVDVVLCDLDMPTMDGMEFMRHFGASGADAPVIITSAHDSNFVNSVRVMAQAYGVRLLGVVEKPANAGNLSALLREARRARRMDRSGRYDAAPSFTLAEIQAGVKAEQLEPYFQPKARLSDGRIIGAEALARWHHPQHGVVTPASFIETLEASGDLEDLTFLMLRQAAIACRRWLDMGLDLGVSVNVSLTSLTDARLASRICGTVHAAGISPAHVTLEITETAAMTDVAPALENLARLRMRGFGLSIDDFGTGFASIQQLGRIAFSELKIDRGFVKRMLERRESRAIVESSLDMARRLGIDAVAEGVETQAEWNALKQAGCPIAQGYLVSRPLPEAEFARFARSSFQ